MLLSIMGELRVGTSPRPVMATRLIVPIVFAAMANLLPCPRARVTLLKDRVLERPIIAPGGAVQRIFVDVCSAAFKQTAAARRAGYSTRARCEQVRITAAIFFAKTKMGWIDRVVNKHAKMTANRS